MRIDFEQNPPSNAACPTGVLPCMTCANVMNIKYREVLEDGLVCITCTDRTQFQPQTNDAIFEAIDAMALLSENPAQQRERGK